ncbi:winged helix DNA-binding domain-containing protein [Flavihumibacter sp. R14]|nr:winged helix DNA-binding domain-containing protein [Flavihumibacter soli]
MNLKDIAYHRLASQQLTGTSFQSVKELVEWMGVMQAQDYAMAKWAVGIRLPGSTLMQINAAIDKGEIIRTHLLRPTWHLVSAEDIYWMLELSAARIRTAAKARLRELELSGDILQKCNLIMERLLTGNKHLTREKIMAELARYKIATDNNRSSHILMQAELDGLICSGVVKGNKQTYALLAERIPGKTAITKDEALEKLASRYFASHGPATLQDFTWWSGLSASDARRGLEMVKSTLVSVVIASQTFWMPASFSFPEKSKHASVHLLPAYDEFVISYTDRSATLNVENHKRSISVNGLFRPVIVINGQVTGLWKRIVKRDGLLIETELFRPHGKQLKNLIEKAAGTFGYFLGLKPQVSFVPEPAELTQTTDA